MGRIRLPSTPFFHSVVRCNHSEMPRDTVFSLKWLENIDSTDTPCSRWLRQGKSKTTFMRTVCNIELSCANGGWSNVRVITIGKSKTSYTIFGSSSLGFRLVGTQEKTHEVREMIKLQKLKINVLRVS